MHIVVFIMQSSSRNVCFWGNQAFFQRDSSETNPKIEGLFERSAWGFLKSIHGQNLFIIAGWIPFLISHLNAQKCWCLKWAQSIRLPNTFSAFGGILPWHTTDEQRRIYIWDNSIFTNEFTTTISQMDPMPGDSKWPFHRLVGGHLTIQKGHLTIPKRSQTRRIARWVMSI